MPGLQLPAALYHLRHALHASFLHPTMRLCTVAAALYGVLLVAALPGPQATHQCVGLDADEAETEVDVVERLWAADHAQHIIGVEGDERSVPPTHPPDHAPDHPSHHPPPPHHPPDHPPHHPLPFPHPPPSPPPQTENKTIYQILSEDPKFSRVFKLVNFTDEITTLLNDSSAKVTFFAPPDWALRPPPHRRHPHPPKRPHHPPHGPPHPPQEDEDESRLLEELINGAPLSDQLDLFAAAESFLSYDDPEDDHKREVFKKIIRAILSYHIIPTKLEASDLAKNTTYPTNLSLNDGSLDGEPLRLRVGPVPRIFPFALSINLYARIVRPDIPAENGVIHAVNHPLLPPPSAFQSAFFLPDVFSTLTSALQRVGLTDGVEWRYVPGSNGEKGTLQGAPAIAFFAPSNRAFARLPKKLKFFLFSPFGEKALKKLLQYHIVPEFVLHSNYLHNASNSEIASRTQEDDFAYHPGMQYNYETDIISERVAAFGEHSERTMDDVRKCIRHSPTDPSSVTMRPCHFSRPHAHHRQVCSSETSPLSMLQASLKRILYGTGLASFLPAPATHWDHCTTHTLPKAPEQFSPPSPPSFLSPPSGAPPPPPHRSSASGPHPPPPGEGNPHLPHPHPPPPVYTLNVTAPTLLANHSLHVRVAQFEHRLPIPGHHHSIYRTVVFVNGHPVALPDVVARNGAVHVVDRLLHPLKHHHHHPPPPEEGEDDAVRFIEAVEDEWADWEEWLPAWANED